MQDGQHRAITHWIEKFVAMPGRCQRPGFGFAIANHRRDEQIRVVKSCAKGMREAVAEFAPFVDRAGHFRRTVAAQTAGE